MSSPDCVTSGFENVDSTMVVSGVTIAAGLITVGSTSIPALQATWTTPSNPYITGYEFQYQVSDLSIGAASDTAQAAILSWNVTNNILPNKSYTVRCRAHGANVVGPWTTPATVTTSTTYSVGSAGSVTWSGVTGTGKPADNATVGAVTGVNLTSGTYGALTDSGTNGVITLIGTSAAITGQGALATSTLTATQVTNSLLPSGTGNRVILSQAEKGTIGWQLGSSSAPFPSLAQQTYGGLTGIQCAFTATAAGQYANTFGATAYRFAVTAGESLACSALFNTTSLATAYFYLEYYNSSGSFLSDATIGSSVPVSSALALRDAILTVPAGAVSAVALFQTTATGAGVAGAAMYQPMVQGVPAGQTTYPAFTPGPISTPGADVTSANTAAAISGQTAWATYGALTPSNVQAPGANLVYDGGLSLKATTWGLGSWGWGTAQDVGNYVGTSTSSAYANSPRFPVAAGYTYTIQAYATTTSTSSGSLPAIYIAWYNSSDVYISESSHASINNSVYALSSVSYVAPSGAVYGRAILYSNSMSTGAIVVVSKVKVESGGVATPFNDLATSGALYATGVTIDSLKPAQVNADVTSTNTAAAIASQSAWATTTVPIASVTTPGSNLVKNPTFLLISQNWSGSLGTAFSNQIGPYAYDATVGAGASAISDFLAVWPSTVYTIQAMMGGVYTNAGGVQLVWYDSSYAQISASYPTLGWPVSGGGYSLLTAFGTSPSTAAYARVYIGWPNIASTQFAIIYKIKAEIGSVATVWTDDATSGALYQTGVTIDSLQPAQSGADVTASHTASAITGQGPLATSSLTAAQVTNANISISSSGVLSGGGGGSVSLTGLGAGTAATGTAPTYAGMASAITAGLTSGQSFIDSTNANHLTAVVTSVGPPKVASATGTGNVTFAAPNTSCHVAFTGLTANGIWSFNGYWNAQSASTPYSGISTASGTWALVETLTSGGSAHTIFSGTWSSGAYNSGAPGINFAPDTTYGSLLQMTGGSMSSTLSGGVTVTLQLQITSASGSMASVTNGIGISVVWTPTQ